MKGFVLKDTADVRARLLEIWKLVDEKKIPLAEARVHISLARAVVDTLKVEIAAAHLAQQQIPTVLLGRQMRTLDQPSRKQ
jgi:hypothetical protein